MATSKRFERQTNHSYLLNATVFDSIIENLLRAENISFIENIYFAALDDRNTTPLRPSVTPHEYEVYCMY